MNTEIGIEGEVERGIGAGETEIDTGTCREDPEDDTTRPRLRRVLHRRYQVGKKARKTGSEIVFSLHIPR